MPLKLPDVTLVVIDHLTHDLTRLALEETLREIEPESILILSDREILDLPKVRWIKTQANSKDDAFAHLWYTVPNFVETSHYLHIEWDGWVIDGSRWTDDWLRFDYIGAPWPWHYRDRVGNGGFSLRSLRLARFLQMHRATYPIVAPEDDTLCRLYRPALEEFDFKWAPEWAAADFSLEHGPFRPTFGFHDCRNWMRVLRPDQIERRLHFAPPYSEWTPLWAEMRQSLKEFA